MPDLLFTMHLRKHKVMEALVRKGRNNPGRAVPCGDALLCHPRARFFAVADSPERNPAAAGCFLKQLEPVLDGFAKASLNGNTAGPFRQTEVDNLVKAIEAVVGAVKANERTTFTGVLVVDSCCPGKALLLHNGDSLIYHFHLSDKRVCRESETNHCLVGKVGSIYQKKQIHFSQNSRFLLATDGFWDIIRRIRQDKPGDPFRMILEMLQAGPVDRVISRLLTRYDPEPWMSDDLALISLDPSRAWMLETPEKLPQADPGKKPARQ